MDIRTHLLPASRLRWLRRGAARLLELAAAGAFLGAFAHHIANFDFHPLAAFCLPVLVVFVGFTSLLFMRGKSLSKGRVQVRTLFAAERSMQATVWYFSGVLSGLAVYSAMHLLPQGGAALGAWVLLAFAVPVFLMQVGLALFMRAAGVIAPQMLRRVSAYEVWRRVREDDRQRTRTSADETPAGVDLPIGARLRLHRNIEEQSHDAAHEHRPGRKRRRGHAQNDPALRKPGTDSRSGPHGLGLSPLRRA
jgi:hypothetical protein